MKKVFWEALIFFCLTVLLFGACSKSNSHTSPTNTNSGNVIVATLARSDYTTPTSIVMYQVVLYNSSMTPISGAVVTVTGPNGVTTLPESYGEYTLGSLDTSYYQFNQQYTVNVYSGGTVYSAVGTAPGNITITADGNTASWNYEGNYDQIQVSDPAGGNHLFGPDLNSPYSISGTGVYNSVTYTGGTYGVMVSVANRNLYAFSGAGVGSALVLEDSLIATFSK